MNKLTKTILLVLYAVGLFALSVLVINLSQKEKRFEEYNDLPYDDYITLNVQMMEIRQDKSETKSDFEKSKFDVYLFVTKKQVVNIENMYSYIAVEGVNNKFGYSETSSAKTLDSGVYQTSTMSFLNSATAFAYHEVKSDDGEQEINQTPKNIYVKVVYDVKVEKITTGENGEEKVSKETLHKELNYKYNISDNKVNNFSNYENRSVGSSSIDCKNDPFQIKLIKTISDKTSTSPEKENYKIALFETKSTNLPANVTIENIDFCVYGVITNKNKIGKYFNEYVRLFDFNGAMVNNRPISSTRTASIAKDYNIEKLYITAKTKLSNGQVIETMYYINTSELLNK